MKLSQKLSDFNTEVTNSVPFLVTPANVTRLKIDPQTVTDAGNFKTDWDSKYGFYINPSTHTDQSVIDINTAYHNFHPFMEGVKKMLKHNMTITLTGTDYSNLHIHIDQPHRTHIPRPAFAPANQLIKSTHLVARIFTSNPQPSFENETHLPVDVVKVGRKVAVMFPFITPPGPIGGGGVATPMPSPEQYHSIEAIGSTTFDLVFEPEQEGATAYLITWYLNARGEAGPPSAPYAFKII
jgi:hypothetical protein